MNPHGWRRAGTEPHRRAAPAGAPLIPEYQRIADAGRHGNNPMPTCRPRAMLPYESMEFIIQPEVTHIEIEFIADGDLRPARKDQAPPDLRNFAPPGN